MGKFRKKPVVIEAVKFTGNNWNEVYDFVIGPGFRGVYIGSDGKPLPNGETSNRMGVIISTLEGDHIASHGDWIIKGVKGEFYPCKPDIFQATYEPVEEVYTTTHYICDQCKEDCDANTATSQIINEFLMRHALCPLKRSVEKMDISNPSPGP